MSKTLVTREMIEGSTDPDGTAFVHANGCAKCGSELAWWYDAKTDSRRCDQCFGFWRVAWELLKMRVHGWLA